jgi:Zn-finger nucleic acid-binding protein
VTGEPLRQEVRQGLTIDVSDAGMWLDKGELLLLTEKDRHEQPDWMLADLFRTEIRPPVDRSRRLKCPVCGHEMQIEQLHGVHVDWCREHGVWLDAGELEAIESNLRLDPLFVGKVATRLWEARY